jgi:hypothetical protein
MADFPIGKYWPLAVVPLTLASGMLLLLICAFLYMARKPYGWGKLLCFVGFPWIWFSAFFWFERTVLPAFPYNPILLGPGLCGTTLLLVGVVLLVIDWGRTLGPIVE